MGNDLDFPIPLLRDLYDIAQVPNAPIDLDFVVEEFLEGRDIEDFVARRLRGIDDVLDRERH